MLRKGRLRLRAENRAPGPAGRSPRIARLVDERWRALARREGTVDATNPRVAADAAACPACGTVGPLVEGACGDCGLQLA